MPSTATPGYAPLAAGVFARTVASPARPVLPEPVPPSPAPAEPTGAEPGPCEREQAELLDLVRAGLVDEARSWARRVRLLHRWPVATGEGFEQLEMAGSWQVSQLTATRWRDEAERFDTCLPLTLAALEAGTLLVHQAQVLLRRTRHCSRQVARAVEAQVLPAAPGLYPADLAKRVDRAVLRLESEALDGAAAEQRHADAAAQRRTWTSNEPDGMGLAAAVLTAEQLVAWHAGLDLLERRERIADREAGVERTRDQRRADLFAALPAMVLAGTAQDAGCDAGRPWTVGPEQLAAQVVLDVHVPVATVLDLSREPGMLVGYGPVSAEHVRLLRPQSLRRVLVDERSGRPLAVDDRTAPVDPDPLVFRRQVQALLTPAIVTDADEPQHDPSAHLARLVDVRDAHCCGPGCSSARTDRDHLVPWPLGPTSAANLGLVSPRCHRAKHQGWTLVRHRDGSTTWTSPLARTYHRPCPHRPPPAVDLWEELPALRPRPVGRPDWPEGPDTDPPPSAAPPVPVPTDEPPSTPPPF